MASWIEEYFAAWSAADPDKVAEWLTDDVEMEDVTAGHVSTGKDAARKFVEVSARVVPDMRYEVVASRSYEDGYWVEWIMHARGQQVRGASVGTLRDGKIASNHDYWNGAAFKL